jgi:hypothetical protein
LAVDRYDSCPQCWFPELSILRSHLTEHFISCNWVCLTNCMEHSPSLEAKVMSQEICQLVWNLGLHYCLDRSPLMASVLKQTKSL